MPKITVLARTHRWSDDLVLDIRYATRTLRNSPWFTTAAVSMLALGFGINIAVFSVTNAVLFKGFRGIARNDRLLYIGTQNNGRGCCVSYPDFEDWRAQTASFDGLAAVADYQVDVTDAATAAEHFDATRITANTFALVGRSPVLGRDFLPSDETPGAAPVAILRYEFWQRRYGADPAILDRTIRINGVPTAVIGVMPPGFSFPQNQDLWLPLVPTPDLLARDNRTLWFAFGRLHEGVTAGRARAELRLIGERLARSYPRTNDGWVPQPRSFAEFFVGVNAPAIYGALWGAVAFVLLIAGANFANLLLARAIGRSREISVRLALGAGRWRIVRQLLVESVILSVGGGIAGWWIAREGVRAYGLMANPPTRSWSEHLLDYAMDERVVLYAIAISLGTGIVFGLLPAFRLWSVDLHVTLKDGGRSATGGARARRLSSALVAAQLACSIVLVVGAGLMIRSFVAMSTAALGVDAERVVTALVSLPPGNYREPSERRSFFDRLNARLAGVPGVEAVSLATALPASGAPHVAYDIDGGTTDGQSRPMVSALTVGTAYFQTVGAALVSGREFTDADGSGTPTAIVNELFANTVWPGENALGRRLRLFEGSSPGPWRTIVGIASNIVQDVTRQRRDPVVYIPYSQQPSASTWVLARTPVVPETLVSVFRREMHALDPDVPIWLGPYPLIERLAGMGTFWSTRTDAALLLVFAVAGLVLAAAGLYAVVAHGVSRRTREIGIRIAIGATPGEIARLVLLQGIPSIGIGLLTGLFASFGLMRVLRSELVRVSPADPVTYAVAIAVLLICAALGCVLPVRRATRVDPVAALRHD